MTDEQTNAPDTEGKEISNPEKEMDAEYTRLKEKNNKIQEELIRGQKLKTESLLSGDTGGHISPSELTPEQQKKTGAKEFFKGTPLAEAIDKL